MRMYRNILQAIVCLIEKLNDGLEYINERNEWWAVAIKLLIVLIFINAVWMVPIAVMAAPMFFIAWLLGAPL